MITSWLEDILIAKNIQTPSSSIEMPSLLPYLQQTLQNSARLLPTYRFQLQFHFHSKSYQLIITPSLTNIPLSQKPQSKPTKMSGNSKNTTTTTTTNSQQQGYELNENMQYKSQGTATSEAGGCAAGQCPHHQNSSGNSHQGGPSGGGSSGGGSGGGGGSGSNNNNNSNNSNNSNSGSSSRRTLRKMVSCAKCGSELAGLDLSVWQATEAAEDAGCCDDGCGCS
ncbi:hypothetical protein F4778DRAFT_795974 [Xylariomycetidae sp. FL2044]|nr:hypothetical protein F4778DRAFT_795974 [Xylariomycetidae sp. FL2044]